MIIYPAIDVKSGKCVRLKQGDMNQVTEFNDDLLSQAREFEDVGFKWLHVVDLDGAVKGRPVNNALIKSMVTNISMKVQIGGGIRDMHTIEKWFDAGVARVVLGTVAIKDFGLVREACKRYPGKIVVGIDARNNKVAIHGWQEESNIFVLDLIDKLSEVGVSAIVYTDITRDGLLSGFDEVGTCEIAKNISIPLIVSGGVSSLEDLYKVRRLEKFGVIGSIVGRAFYDKKISYNEIEEFL